MKYNTSGAKVRGITEALNRWQPQRGPDVVDRWKHERGEFADDGLTEQPVAEKAERARHPWETWSEGRHTCPRQRCEVGLERRPGQGRSLRRRLRAPGIGINDQRVGREGADGRPKVLDLVRCPVGKRLQAAFQRSHGAGRLPVVHLPIFDAWIDCRRLHAKGLDPFHLPRQRPHMHDVTPAGEFPRRSPHRSEMALGGRRIDEHPAHGVSFRSPSSIRTITSTTSSELRPTSRRSSFQV